jgi:gamma-glutamyl hercynylcysteine S-oxide synthase
MNGRATVIAGQLAAVRERTWALFAPLAEADLSRTPDPIMSPPIWDLGHIAAYEELWLACTVGGESPQYPELQRAYDAFETPRAERTKVTLLDAAACREYVDAVRARALDVLAAADLDPDGPRLLADGFAFEMVAQHEAQHTETVLQALQMYEDGTYRPVREQLPRAPQVDDGDRVSVAGGTFAIGAGGSGFAYDCERPRHERVVAPFALDRYPVSNARHLAFMDDGGYSRRELWSVEGWKWREHHDVVAPLYWQRDGGGWWVRTFDQTVPVDPRRPVCHVSFFEAEAHARWAGGRLPDEHEWEAAAICAPTGSARYPWGDGWTVSRANLGQRGYGVAPLGAYDEGAAPSGCIQMIGDVWEWTSTAFHGYPGFAAFPYPEYAEVFFGDRYRVLRGGSWATQPIAARTTFRNWDLPQRRQIFSGFRLAWDLDSSTASTRENGQWQ